MAGFVHRFLPACCSMLLSMLLLAACGSVAQTQGAATPVPAAQVEGLAMQSRAAFGGAYRAGNWLPVIVELRNTGPDRKVEVRVQTTSSASYAASIDLPNAASKLVTLYVAIPNVVQRLQVQLVVDGVEAERQVVRLQPYSGETHVVGVVSASGAGRRIPNLAANGPALRTVGVQLNELPLHPAGLSLFTTLVLDDVATLELNAAQRDALEGWVMRGGQLIVGGGAGTEATLAGLPKRLQIVRVAALKTLAARDLYGPDGPAGQLTIAQLEPASSPEGLPQPYVHPLPMPKMPTPPDLLLYEQTLGKGAVNVVALPLNGPAFESWPGQPRFWSEVLWRPESLPPGFAPNTFTIDGLIEGNLAASLTGLPALEFPSLMLLGGLLLAYVLLVGPVTYLLLRRFDRLALGWVVVPAITLVFAGLSYGFGYAQRGGEVLFNQVTLVEPFDGGASELARRRSLVGIFSPAQRQYTIDVRQRDGGPAPLLRPISVQGPWDTNLSSQSGIFIQEQDDPPLGGARVHELDIPQWSLRAIIVDTTGPYKGMRSQVTFDGTELQGEVENRSDHRLEDVTIVQGDQVVRLGDLEPGESRSGTLKRLPNNGANALSSPLSYLIYREQLDASNQQSQSPLSPEIQTRIRLLDTLFSYGPSPRSGQPIVIAWGRDAGVDVALPEERADRQAIELITFAPEVLVGEGQVDLGRGWLNQRVDVGQEGVCFGNLGVGVNLIDQPVTTELHLPRTLIGLKAEAMTLITAADGPWPAGALVELYDWEVGDWVAQTTDNRAAAIDEPERFLGSHGRVRARFSKPADNFGTGCLYLDATLKGRMP